LLSRVHTRRRAAHVVTGDRAFLDLREHAGVEIVTPRAFLDLLGS